MTELKKDLLYFVDGKIITYVGWHEKGVPTFGEYAMMYLDEKKWLWKRTTYCTYKWMLVKRLIPCFGNFGLDEITNKQIQDFTNRLSISLSPKTTREHVALLKEILKDAMQNNIIQEKRFSIKFKKSEKNSCTVLDDDEINLLRSYCLADSRPGSLGILIALETGARVGEISCLQWKDFDYLKRSIKIEKDVARVYDTETKKSEIVIQSPKTPKSKRTIYLSQQIAEHLEKNRPFNGELYICTGTKTPSEPRNMRSILNRRLTACGIRHIKFHDLRHTFATRAIRAGIDVKTVSELLGHEKCSLTLDIYTSCTEDAKRAAVDYLYQNKKE